MTSQENTGIVGPIESLLTVGESTMPILNAQTDCQPSSGQLRFTYFTARKSEVITQIRIPTCIEAAAATPTLCRVGVWSESPTTGGLTPLANLANDVTLFAAAQTPYTRTLSASFNKVRGTRYAVGILVVSSAAMPAFNGSVLKAAMTAEAGLSQRKSALMSVADLPAGNISAGSLSNSAHMHYAVLLP